MVSRPPLRVILLRFLLLTLPHLVLNVEASPNFFANPFQKKEKSDSNTITLQRLDTEEFLNVETVPEQLQQQWAEMLETAPILEVLTQPPVSIDDIKDHKLHINPNDPTSVIVHLSEEARTRTSAAVVGPMSDVDGRVTRLNKGPKQSDSIFEFTKKYAEATFMITVTTVWYTNHLLPYVDQRRRVKEKGRNAAFLFETERSVIKGQDGDIYLQVNPYVALKVVYFKLKVLRDGEPVNGLHLGQIWEYLELSKQLDVPALGYLPLPDEEESHVTDTIITKYPILKHLRPPFPESYLDETNPKALKTSGNNHLWNLRLDIGGDDGKGSVQFRSKKALAEFKPATATSLLPHFNLGSLKIQLLQQGEAKWANTKAAAPKVQHKSKETQLLKIAQLLEGYPVKGRGSLVAEWEITDGSMYGIFEPEDSGTWMELGFRVSLFKGREKIPLSLNQLWEPMYHQNQINKQSVG